MSSNSTGSFASNDPTTADKAKVEGLPIVAILAPAELKGYIIVEAERPHIVDELIRGMRHTRERVQGTISPEEVDHYIETKPVVEGLEEGTLVEVIAGPFKGMQARCQWRRSRSCRESLS